MVDDDVSQRSIYVANLKTAGFDVLEGQNGREGLNLTLEHKPDLVMTALMMPVMGGFDFLEAVRANPSIADTSFIAFSHLGNKEDEERSHKLGVKAFLVKGMISPREVVSLIQDIIEKKVYTLAVDTTKLDGPSLALTYGLGTELFIKLIREPNQKPHVFRAEFMEKEDHQNP